jgi:hypothetical protein
MIGLTWPVIGSNEDGDINGKPLIVMWIVDKICFFALCDGFTNDAGYADLDWFRRDETD